MALFVLAFLAVAVLVRSSIPPPRTATPVLRSKFRSYSALSDDVSLLFVGASTVHRGVVPSVLDEELARRGVDATTFNFGVPGMGPLEADHLLRTLLERPRPALRWVVLEILDSDPPAPDRGATRPVWWHTPRQTLRAVAHSWRGRRSFGDGVADAAAELPPFARHVANVSLASWLVFGTGHAPHAPQAEIPGRRERGYAALDDDHRPRVLSRRRQFVRSPDAYLRRVEMARRAVPAHKRPCPPTEGFLREQAAFLRAHGVEPLYLVTPVPEAMPTVDALGRDGAVSALLAFNDPAEHPELFRLDRRFDGYHLSARGAQAFSRVLAERLAPLLSGRPPEEPTAAGDPAGEGPR